MQGLGDEVAGLITVGVSLEPGKFGLVMKGTPEELEPLDGEDRGEGQKFIKMQANALNLLLKR
ncbi:hypothetical protein ACRE_025450 [Hapsidospora chrysogenum ATCC 11550]|uniref:Uncharacterized protein n=1 Tax=Hapsidospora chrysogenum (strain ATCC 11550 / CBS 779.69 / DSM 880 / IAM 14645 / JCM 23072 / IMI 49137) TaxID=857340 RepID=A0A086TBD6_HAPC1|nr:hypothetical protein ACRE_025450 [Hapsidospora chrysogenum ATCC 11550]